jgi:hypothetical protein
MGSHSNSMWFLVAISSISLSWLITEFLTRVTWRVWQIEQELLNLPRNTCSSWFCGVPVTLSLVFCLVFYRPLFVCLRLANVLSVIRFTVFGYSFSIKLFLSHELISVTQQMHIKRLYLYIHVICIVVVYQS